MLFWYFCQAYQFQKPLLHCIFSLDGPSSDSLLIQLNIVQSNAALDEIFSNHMLGEEKRTAVDRY